EDVEKRAPTGVVNALGQRMITRHPGHVQVFDADAPIALRVLLGGLEMKIPPLATNFQMLAGHCSARFAATMAAFCTAAGGALRVRKVFLLAAVVARALDHAARRV